VEVDSTGVSERMEKKGREYAGNSGFGVSVPSGCKSNPGGSGHRVSRGGAVYCRRKLAAKRAAVVMARARAETAPADAGAAVEEDEEDELDVVVVDDTELAGRIIAAAVKRRAAIAGESRTAAHWLARECGRAKCTRSGWMRGSLSAAAVVRGSKIAKVARRPVIGVRLATSAGAKANARGRRSRGECECGKRGMNVDARMIALEMAREVVGRRIDRNNDDDDNFNRESVGESESSEEQSKRRPATSSVRCPGQANGCNGCRVACAVNTNAQREGNNTGVARLGNISMGMRGASSEGEGNIAKSVSITANNAMRMNRTRRAVGDVCAIMSVRKRKVLAAKKYTTGGVASSQTEN